MSVCECCPTEDTGEGVEPMLVGGVFCVLYNAPPKFAWPHEAFSSKSICTDIGTDGSSDVYKRRYFQDTDQANKTQSASLKVLLQIISPNLLEGMRFLARQTGI